MYALHLKRSAFNKFVQCRSRLPWTNQLTRMKKARLNERTRRKANGWRTSGERWWLLVITPVCHDWLFPRIYHSALYLFFVVLRYFVLCPVKRRCLVFSARFIFFSFLLFCFYDWLFFCFVFFILFRWRALLMWCASFAFLVARFLFNFKFTTLALVAKWNARESELFAV